jgi:hypothetical protein
MSEANQEEVQVTRTKRSQLTIQIVGGAIFGALSTVLAIVLSPLINASRIQAWGFALFDPTSWVWIISFLIFGPTAGVISSIVGSFGLLIMDPTGIGPAFKFTATISLIIVPTLLLKLWKTGIINSKKLKDPKNYVMVGIISILVRIGVMLVFNILFFIVAFGGVDMAFVVPVVLIVNTYTSVLDLVVPYLLVFLPKLDEKFEFW